MYLPLDANLAIVVDYLHRIVDPLVANGGHSSSLQFAGSSLLECANIVYHRLCKVRIFDRATLFIRERQ